jgi:hypothetical protein
MYKLVSFVENKNINYKKNKETCKVPGDQVQTRNCISQPGPPVAFRDICFERHFRAILVGS